MVELMIALTLVAVLMALALPSFQTAGAKTRIKSQTNDLMSAIATARSEAIRRGLRVTLCSSTNGTACAADAWASGFVMFEDKDADLVLDTGETVLRSQKGAAEGITVKKASASASAISFGPDGRSKSATGGAVSYVLRVCHTMARLNNDERATDIAVSTTGRMSVTAPTSIADSCAAPTL